MDEYGDAVPIKQEFKEGEWCRYLDPEKQSLLNLDSLSALPLDPSSSLFILSYLT